MLLCFHRLGFDCNSMSYLVIQSPTPGKNMNILDLSPQPCLHSIIRLFDKRKLYFRFIKNIHIVSYAYQELYISKCYFILIPLVVPSLSLVTTWYTLFPQPCFGGKNFSPVILMPLERLLSAFSFGQ